MRKLISGINGLVAGGLLIAAFAGHAQDAMFVDSAGNVGVGTNTPAKKLHVLGSDSGSLATNNTQVRVENNSGTTARRDMFSLSNNGEVKFTMENSSSGATWDFSARSNGFNINLLGTGGQELLISPAGEFRVGPGGTANFTVQPDGDVLVGGAIVHSSSRTTKHDIVPVDDDVILSKLGRLDLAEWTYKRDVDGDRHLSPMAEDFYAAFGLGPDNKHVSPSDLAGVALAATKALKVQNDNLTRENQALREDVATLRSELTEIKTSLSHLETNAER